MPTKPTLAFVFASDVNYTTGPAPLIATPTKITRPLAQVLEGWTADEVPPAQHQNYILNQYSIWDQWTSLGTPVADPDRHLVETDILGETAVVDVTAGGNRQAPSSLGWYGNGQNGSLVVTTTVTLTEDKHYNNLTITAPGILQTDGWRVFVKGTLTINTGGIIRCNGVDGEDGGVGTGAGTDAQGGAGGGQIPGTTNRRGSVGRGSAGGDASATAAPSGNDGENIDLAIGGTGGPGGKGDTSGNGGAAGVFTLPPLVDGGFLTAHAACGHLQGGWTGNPTANGYEGGLLNGGAGGGGGSGPVVPG